MNHDPKLKEAMAEIDLICKKHDIGGFVFLVSKTNSEAMFHLEPSWSAIIMNENRLEFKIDPKEVGEEKARELARFTCNLIFMIRDMCDLGFKDFSEISEKFKKLYKVERKSDSGILGLNNGSV